MDPDHNLLFGIRALEANLIDAARFVEGCQAWSRRQDVPLAAILRERGWITPFDEAEVERRLAHPSQDTDANRTIVQVARPHPLSATRADSELQSLCPTILQHEPPEALPSVEYVSLNRERYTLMQIHGAGGIGRVWLARDQHIGRDVALKELRPETASNLQCQTRFLKEARITGQLEHPSIVPVYELTRRPENQQPFYTMRFVKGRTLCVAAAAYHEKRTAGTAETLDFAALLQAFVGVCNAVAYAHSRGVIHRDLKGENIILGDFGEVIVLDWGLAKVLGPAEGDGETPPVVVDPEGEAVQTVQGQVIGTPAYMAPEQADGRLDLISPATDVYGLGAILYEVLTGQPPFSGATTKEVLRKVREESPVRPCQVWAGVPPALEAIALRALAKKRGDRYASARELAGEVQRWLADEPVWAYPEPWTLRLGRWRRRHKTRVAALAALLVTAVVVLSLSTVLILREKRQTDANYQMAEANYQVAQDQKARAERFLKKAQDAVFRYHNHVSSFELLKEPGLQPLRKKLLQIALEYYQDFVAEDADDPAIQAERGRVFYRLATVTEEIGSKLEALKLRQDATDIFQQLVHDYPEDLPYQLNLAKCQNGLGKLYEVTGQPGKAEEFYRKALDRFGHLAQMSSAPDTAKDARQDLATCHRNLGTFYIAQNWLTEAEEHLGRAREIQEAFAAGPDAPALQRKELAATLNSLGGLYRLTKRPRLAEGAFKRMQALGTQLAREDPKDFELQGLVAMSHNNLAVIYRETNRLKEAESECQSALAIQEKVQRANPTVTTYQLNLALALNNLAALYRATARTEQAVTQYRKAADMLLPLRQTYPENTMFALYLGVTCGNLGEALAGTGEPRAALEWFARAIDALEYVLKREERNASARQYLRNDHWWRAEALVHLKDYPAALGDWERALQLDDGRAQGELRRLRAWTRARMGDFERALAEVGPLAEAPDADADALYTAARTLALAAGAKKGDPQTAEQLAARAVAYLRRAVAKGFQDAEQVKKESDLDSLRQRAEFKAVLAEVEKKARTGSK
jgi:serine/threonine-protein kinase